MKIDNAIFSLNVPISQKGAAIFKKLMLFSLFIIFSVSMTFNIFFVGASEISNTGGVWDIILNSTVGDVVINYTVRLPLNNSYIYDVDDFVVQMNITNTTVSNVQMSIDLNGTWIEMSNRTGTGVSGALVNYSFVNNTMGTNWYDGEWHNLTFRIANGTSIIWWTNDSLIRFRFYEAVDNTISITSYLEGTVNSQTENVNLTASPLTNASACNAYVNDINEGNTTIVLTNTTVGRGAWSNASAIIWNNTAYGNYTYLTVGCQDSFSNYSWFNTSVEYSTWRSFKYDSIKPTINLDGTKVITIGNHSNGNGNYINYSIESTDNTSISLVIKGIYITGAGNDSVFRSDYAIANSSGNENYYNRTRYSNGTQQINANFTPDSPHLSGLVNISVEATDEAGNKANAGNYTVQIRLFKIGWNYYGDFRNVTVRELSRHINNISYVTWFDNRAGYKNWTTHTVGGTTNIGHTLNATNTTGVYVTQDMTLIAPSFTGMEYHLVYNINMTLNQNSTSEGTDAWNTFGTLKRHSLNNTMWITNSSGWSNVKVGANTENVTWACVWDASNQRYVCGNRGRNALTSQPVSGSYYTVTNYTFSPGTAVWVGIKDQVNITINRTKMTLYS